MSSESIGTAPDAFESDLRTEEMLLNMGPQHPATHGVLRVLVRTDGEMVLDCDPHVGYLHRCFEKHCESVTFLQSVLYTDRLDYLTAMGNNWGYCMAVEKLYGDDLEIPERAQYIRVIYQELNRIASHLLAVGTYGMDVGAITPFLYCFREREKILYIFETISGQRLNYNYVRPGGVAYDLTDDMVRMIKDFCTYFKPKVQEYNDLLSANDIFIKRTAHVGILPLETALQYGCTGPVLRGCGVARDLRKDQPYGVYDRFEFDVPVGTGESGTLGDCLDRYMVRVREMEQSIRIVEQAIEALPGGEYKSPKIKAKVRPPKGEAYTRIENSRGEVGFYIVSDGKDVAYRCKCRAPSFHNIHVLPEISRGQMMADLIAIIGSMDIVLGEVDR
ncbi:MAG: NADH-quinone oxidoreductase subunit NuoD [Phycisphaeraceae bacterium]|nr:NADH-quinone oxidoreductase subunit NuoD [Phycisphaeraceae bacterium]